MEMRSLEETRALLGPAAEGLSDAGVLALRDAAYQFAFGIYAAYTAVDAPYLTQDQRRAVKGLPPQGRPRRKPQPTSSKELHDVTD